ncbi:MAG: insulinase family protein [Ignavibacteria bacterium]|jgi:zinc protease|nr:insulinase family protein [Ignavibacteria bacterium]MCU7512825.1 insulinase family protein [Ignavibacteria bacterium]MCU7525965.1 insulinase family protein [Ignavibacteria bacterium]
MEELNRMNELSGMEELNRTKKPQPKGRISFTLPEIEKFTLDNGLEVLFVKKERLPIIQLSLIIDAGSRFDPNEKKGLSILVSSLLDEGAGGLGSLELSNAIESLGSVLSVSSDPDAMFISLLSLSETFDKSLDLYSKVITKPHLAEEDMQREKRKQINRIIQAKDDAGYIASVLFEKLVYTVHSPYGLPEMGLTETVEKISSNDIRLFYETLITPQNSTLIVVGSIDKEILRHKLNIALLGWHTHMKPIISVHNPPREKTRLYFVQKEGAAQSEIRIGHLTEGRNKPDFFARALMNSILGGQFSSRINLNLREDKGYTYGAHSGFNYNKVNGYFYVSAPVKTENTKESIIEILKELKGIQVYISEKELKFAKSSQVRKFPALFETYGQIGRSLANMIIYCLPDDYFNTFLDNIKKVTLEEAYEAAHNYIIPDELVIMVVGDREAVKPQLEALNLGSITELDRDGNVIGTV